MCDPAFREKSPSPSNALVVVGIPLGSDRTAGFQKAMDDPYDLVLGMFALAIAAVMLVAGELYLVMRPYPPEANAPPPSVVTSSINLPGT